MVKDICLVINNTGRDIKIAELWKKYLAEHKDTYSTPPEGDIIKRNGYTSIKRSEFIKNYHEWQRLNDADLYKWVYLSDDSKNGVVLSKKDIDDNIGFVIMIKGKNNQLVKEPVSKEEAKSPGERKESEKELKDRLISIVARKNVFGSSQRGNEKNGGQIGQNNASADPAQGGNGENGGQINASACPSQEGKGKNGGQNNASAGPSQGGNGENGGQINASASPSQEGKGKNGGQNNASTGPSQGGTVPR